MSFYNADQKEGVVGASLPVIREDTAQRMMWTRPSMVLIGTASTAGKSFPNPVEGGGKYGLS